MAAWHRGRVFLGRIILTAVSVWMVSAAAVLWWGTRDTSGRADAIVVLGAAQYDGHPSPVLKARLDHAITLYERGLAPWIVTTGGQGTGDTTSEAAVGRRYVIRAGVPDSAILMESRGRSTSTSLAGVSQLARERHFVRVILVSDAFHLLRVALLARHFDLQSMTSPARTSPIAANRAEMLSYILSESLKVPLTLVSNAFDR